MSIIRFSYDPAMTTERYTLVIKADRTVRIARRPRIGADEVGVRVNITFPQGWGQTIGSIDITAPDFMPEIKYEQVEDAQVTP